MTNHWTVCDGGKGCYLGVLTGISTVVKRWLDNAPTKWMVLWCGKSMKIKELNGRFSSWCLITRGYKQQELGLNRLTIPFHNFSHILPLSISFHIPRVQPSSQGPGPTLGSARHMPAFSLAFRSAKWKLFLKGNPKRHGGSWAQTWCECWLLSGKHTKNYGNISIFNGYINELNGHFP